jgi:hypothetical protein
LLNGYPAVAGLVKTNDATFLNIGDIFGIFLPLLRFGKNKKLALYFGYRMFRIGFEKALNPPHPLEVNAFTLSEATW